MKVVRGVAEEIAAAYKADKNCSRPGKTASQLSSKFGSIYCQAKKASECASGGEERIHWIAR